MAKRGYGFEYSIKKALERFLEEFNIRGRVRREYQRSPYYEGVDITIDSTHPYYYAAFECKSRRVTRGTKHLVLFHTRKDGRSQYDVIDSYLCDTGRRGFLVVELKPNNTAYLMQWENASRQPELVEHIRSQPQLEKIGGEYRFTDETFAGGLHIHA